jgi:hypothetical protein
VKQFLKRFWDILNDKNFRNYRRKLPFRRTPEVQIFGAPRAFGAEPNRKSFSPFANCRQASFFKYAGQNRLR